MKINTRNLPPNFTAKFYNYFMARTKHRLTVGEPAPFPDDEVLRSLAECIERGDEIEIEDETPDQIRDLSAQILTLQARIKELENGVGGMAPAKSLLARAASFFGLA